MDKRQKQESLIVAWNLEEETMLEVSSRLVTFIRMLTIELP